MKKRISSAEKNLLTISVVSFIIQTVAFSMLLIMMLYANTQTQDNPWSTLIYQLVDITYDLITINSPWTLLIFSTKSRQYSLRILGRSGKILPLPGSSVVSRAPISVTHTATRT
ncbi:unnamed protein product [Caenorhabditis angaria]|uniref:Serpentine receptor class gamma n=1 Tax=Caenorhabditis angaria TaxID=860376 RepID=A0A9P1MYF7_9PELO|nr:unnamed protein product [Caenorhabditis angaria]